MKTDSEIYEKTADILNAANSERFAPASSTFIGWLTTNNVPFEIIELFGHLSPKVETWLGAGSLYVESHIISCNKLLPEALQVDLLIFGSAPNGDHIALNLADGAVGYICHEADWQKEGARKWFIGASDSLGSDISGINFEESLPEENGT